MKIGCNQAINFQSLIHHTRKHKLINLFQNLVHIYIFVHNVHIT